MSHQVRWIVCALAILAGIVTPGSQALIGALLVLVAVFSLCSLEERS